ncbi:hypothetical protein [Cyanobium sp. ULC084]
MIPSLIRCGITLLAAIVIAWVILPERALAAQPNNVVICKTSNLGDPSCRQNPLGQPPKNTVFWHPQDAPPTNPTIGISGKISRLTLAGNLPLNGTGNGSSTVGPNIMVGNISSNTFVGGRRSTTYVLGNSAQTNITRLPSCAATGSIDCLAVSTTGIASEQDRVTFGSSTNDAVYINRAMETGTCLSGLYYWNSNVSKFVMGATTYGGGNLNSTGGWIGGDCPITPVP